MTRTEAHALLDAARDGIDVPAWRITAALQTTGDVPHAAQPLRDAETHFHAFDDHPTEEAA